MIGAGTFISPLIKIITTVAILAAVYFFIVKPVLDTTENVSSGIGRSFEGFNDLGPNIQKSVREAERIQGTQAASSSAQIEEANKLLACISEANQDIDRIERCNQRFDPANP
jgi:hypothetical protein